jgi:hypothetical protein
MSMLPVAVMSQVDFERARDAVSGFSRHFNYEDWLDCRHGLSFGLSISGVDACLVTVALEDFLHWCEERGLRPSETAFEAYGQSTKAQENASPSLVS